MICALLLSLVPAAMPDVVTLTAVLQEDGLPVDRAVAARFSLWDAPGGGEVVWKDDERTVLVVDGVLVVDIGTRRSLPPGAFTEQLWLEIVVDDQVLSPRVRVGSAPHALEATHAARCTELEGLPVEHVEALVDIASSRRHIVFARPFGCGGGLGLDADCRALPCGSLFLTCEGQCTSSAPALCPAVATGWILGP